MKIPGLKDDEAHLIQSVFDRHPEVTGILLYGSRAKGTGTSSSDIDLALEGISDPLEAAAIAGDLDELPLPYKFDVRALATIQSSALLNEIESTALRLPIESRSKLPDL